MTITKTETNHGQLIFVSHGQWFAIRWPLGEVWRVSWLVFRWMCKGLLTLEQAKYVYQLAKELEAMR